VADIRAAAGNEVPLILCCGETLCWLYKEFNLFRALGLLWNSRACVYCSCFLKSEWTSQVYSVL